MKILAIDPSLTNTAAVFGDADGYAVKCFPSKPCGTSVFARMDRCREVRIDLEDWIEDQRKLAVTFQRIAIYIEGYSFGSRGAAVTQIAEFGGVLRYFISQYSSRVYEVAPTTLKKFCTGKGAGKKEMVIAHLMKRYDVEFNTNDEYDAYGLYRLGLVAEGLVEPANQAQREAVDTVLGRSAKKSNKRRVRSED